MTVYLAAPWARKPSAIMAKRFLQFYGIDVVSTWTEQADTDDPVEMRRNAMSDRDELYRADVLVLLNLQKSDGKATEMGMALGLEKPVIVVGGREGNIFYWLPEPRHVPHMGAAVDLLLQEPLPLHPVTTFYSDIGLEVD